MSGGLLLPGNLADTSSGSVQSFTSNVSAPALIAAGLTGATQASRYVGATTSGAPASGTFAVGDFVVDQTAKVWVCTSAGTPGTWLDVASTRLALTGGTMSGAIAMGANKITGLANGTVSTDAAAFGQIGVFYGQVVASAAPVIPSLWLLCDGTTKSRTTYSALFAALCPPLGNPTVTIASPGVFSLTTHGFVNGDTVYLTTTGALPTGLSANTLYYVVVSASNTFELSTTRGGAAINTSGSQSGTHTINACPYGLGNGSTTFNVPNLLGAVPLGTGASGQNGATTHTMGQVGGEETHLLLSTESGQPGFTTGIESADHTHNVAGNSGNGGTQTGIPSDIYNSGQIVTTSGQSATHTHSVVAANAASAHNILPSYQGVKYIIYAGA